MNIETTFESLDGIHLIKITDYCDKCHAILEAFPFIAHKLKSPKTSIALILTKYLHHNFIKLVFGLRKIVTQKCIMVLFSVEGLTFASFTGCSLSMLQVCEKEDEHGVQSS